MFKIISPKKLILFFFFLLICIVAFSFAISGTSFYKKKLNFSFSIFRKIYRAFAQEVELRLVPYLFPRFPQRLIYLLGEGEKLSREIIKLNQELNESLEQNCDCANAISECRVVEGKCIPVKVLGNVCNDLVKINDLKEEINDRIDNLALVREVLLREMKSGLKEELKTLAPELAQEIESKLNQFLEESENLIDRAVKNREIYSKDYTPRCKAECKAGPIFGVKNCARLGVGPQKSIQLKAKVGITLKDIEMGEVKIEKFGIALPEKLRFPTFGDITLSIPPQTLSVCFPFEKNQLTLQPPYFESLPTLSFTCPSLPPLEFPQFKIPKLPKDIKIPLPSIPSIKSSLEQGDIPGLEESERIREELIRKAQEEIENFKKQIEESVNQINQLLQEAPEDLPEDVKESTKEEFEKEKNEILEEYKKVEEEISKELKTPPVEFTTQGISKEHQYQSLESKGLETKFTSSYQCAQTPGNYSVESSPWTNWYFEILSWLMEECTKFPGMSTRVGLANKAKDCYNPDKVVETIIKECESLERRCGLFIQLPEICQKIGYSCTDSGSRASEVGAAIQCQELFKQEALPVPSECEFVYSTFCPLGFTVLEQGICVRGNFNPISVLSNKCSELKDKGRENPPLPCKLLPLFKRSLENPAEEKYFSSRTKCPAQNLLNLPFGFGGGIGFSCPISIPTSPKIVLPDIVIPDITLPAFRVPPFFEIKLPKIIIEDIILPDLELCDLNKCANIFPDLNFRAPQLNLSTFDLNVPVPQIPNFSLLARVDFLPIVFSPPQINLFNLLLPELSLPEISLPSPQVTFAITGIDLSPIFDLIFTFIINALGSPDYGFCLDYRIHKTFLSIVFPDYYVSFDKFLGKYAEKIPSWEIPFCKDINNFCEKIRNGLGQGGWRTKAKDIESVLNGVIGKIQRELDEGKKEIEEETKKALTQVFQQEYGEIIYRVINEELMRRGLSFEEYIKNQKEKECFLVPLPERKIIIKLGNFATKRVEKKNNQTLIYIPLNISNEIPIPWPERLKEKITLQNPISYALPKYPLSALNYEKEFTIKGPGFQPKSFSIDFGKINQGDCNIQPPSGENPFPLDQIRAKIEEMRDIESKINESYQTVKKFLE